MRIFYNENKKIKEIETDCLDIISKKYVIRIRSNGIIVIRKPRPKKGLEAEVRIDKDYDLS